MHTATLNRSPHPAHTAPPVNLNFSGTLRMLQLYLRRDRVVLLLSLSLGQRVHAKHLEDLPE